MHTLYIDTITEINFIKLEIRDGLRLSPRTVFGINFQISVNFIKNLLDNITTLSKKFFKKFPQNLKISTQKSPWRQPLKVVADMKVEAKYAQAEKLLISIEEMLGKNNLKLGDIEKIVVENKGDGFTALRIGVVTANALGYGLNVPVEGTDGEKLFKDDEYSVVKPNYTREPNIT